MGGRQRWHIFRYLRTRTAKGEWVVEIDHPVRRRGGGKTDALDAVAAAREALARDRLDGAAGAG